MEKKRIGRVQLMLKKVFWAVFIGFAVMFTTSFCLDTEAGLDGKLSAPQRFFLFSFGIATAVGTAWLVGLRYKAISKDDTPIDRHYGVWGRLCMTREDLDYHRWKGNVCIRCGKRDDSFSPLINAIKNGQVEKVRRYIRAGADLAGRSDNDNGRSVLSIALGAGHQNQKAIVKDLLAGGADYTECVSLEPHNDAHELVTFARCRDAGWCAEQREAQARRDEQREMERW